MKKQGKQGSRISISIVLTFLLQQLTHPLCLTKWYHEEEEEAPIFIIGKEDEDFVDGNVASLISIVSQAVNSG
ncbi:hypothetical protein P8452_18164 [Trifolium repens]|nr:hypothetical protein P8452_18164 [Trifolium repens]